jgi:cysteine desulfurase
MAFLCGASHKFFGPKGVGFVYINNANMIKPLMHGGDQERGLRSGTENIYGIAGMSTAFQLALENMEQRKQAIERVSKHFKNRLSTEFQDITFNGSSNEKLYNILSVSFPPSDTVDMLMMNLDIMGISASSGSACSSGVESDSHVLSHIQHDSSRKTIRFSFSHMNTIEEADYVIEKLKTITPVK